MSSNDVYIHYNGVWQEMPNGDDSYIHNREHMKVVSLPDDYTWEQLRDITTSVLELQHGSAIDIYGLVHVSVKGFNQPIILNCEAHLKFYQIQYPNLPSFFTVKSTTEASGKEESHTPTTPAKSDSKHPSDLHSGGVDVQHDKPHVYDQEFSNMSKRRRTSTTNASSPEALQLRILHDFPLIQNPEPDCQPPSAMRRLRMMSSVRKTTLKKRGY